MLPASPPSRQNSILLLLATSVLGLLASSALAQTLRFQNMTSSARVSTSNALFLNNGNGAFNNADFSADVAHSNTLEDRGVAAADYDKNGGLDIFFSNAARDSDLLRNTTATSNKWLRLALRGVESNRNGIGARVLVTNGGVVQTQQLIAGSATVSGGNDFFGFANNSVAAREEVIWPSGTRDVLINAVANQTLTITEGNFGNGGSGDNIAPNNNGEVTRTILSDPLNGSTLGARTGGVFENTGGWRTTSPTDMIMYDLGTYVENGELEIELKNFQPSKQNSHQRHHFLSMFRNPWGNHHAHENTETVWDMHAGMNYTPGLKLLSWTYNVREEERSNTYDEFDPAATYRMRLVWSDSKLQYFLDDVLQITHVLSAPLQVRYLYLGRDFTVSGDYVTEFNGNQYPALVGPRFLNLIVTETLATSDNAAPRISNLASTELFANAARLSWATNEATTCYVEYGLTATYGQRTPVLGPPTQNHETTLAALNPGQTYHYRIVAQDDAGNTRSSPDNTFTTSASRAFLFKPTADTYVERGDIHGETRDRANFGWINLIVSANQESYLRFQTTGLDAPVKQSKLRLRTRQAGTSAAVIRKLLGNWEEMGVTWLTKPAQLGDSLATLTDFRVDQWSEAALKSFVTGNATYNLALLGTTTGEVSLDSRESTNFQPELIVTLRETNAPVIVNVSAGNLTHEAATISWTTNEASDSQVEYGLSTSYGSLSALDTAHVTEHSVVLAGLSANTAYHFRVKSRNRSGNPGLSQDSIFTTAPAPLPSVALHGVYEFTLRARQLTPNNYVQGPSVNVTFQGISGAALGSTMTVQGFWEGADLYRVRFAPSKTGEWKWQTSSSDQGLNNKSGNFKCEGALAVPHVSQRGHVRESKVYPYTYAHADSTPFFLLGDTQWSFATSAITWPAEFQTYVDARAGQGFNYVHGLVYNVFPDSNESNEGGPIFYSSDVDSLNPAFFRALDQRVAYMNEKGIVVGLMFAWGNGGWQNFTGTEQVDRFVRYVINRYAAYNVFWILAGEYEGGAVTGGYARLGELVAAHDVYDHPTTIHTIHTSATEFGNAAWQTTIYQQVFHSRQVTPDRVYNKPVINSEYGYEGDQTAEEVRKDAWQIVMRGGFGVYGDKNTYHFNAKMTPQFLNSPGAALMTILKKFWTGNDGRTIAWQRFTRFEALGNSRFLAGEPEVAYVVYVENRDAFTLDLAEASGTIAGRWFDTRTGNWSANFSVAASAAFALTPPAGGYAAYLRVVKDSAPPVITSVAAGELTTARATITWRTDEPATSQVEYGPDKNYGATSALDTALVASHRAQLSGLKSNTTYHYRVKSQDAAGNLAVSDDSTFVTLVSNSIEEQKQATLLPAAWALRVYPNPFNLATRLQLALPEQGRVRAVIYNLQGQEVKRLRDEEFNAGAHVLHWNGADERNATVTSGIYILRVIFEGASGRREVTTRRLILMK